MWTDHSTLMLALAVLVGVVSIARTLRLLIFDDFPPIAWARAKALSWFPEDSTWAVLLECPFCLAPYLTAGMVGWAYLSDLHWTWWVVNGGWAAAYAAAIIVSYDQPE